MSTTISGTNGVTFPDSTSMQTGQQACKAWVNFNGTGTVAIRESYNVSSITDNGTGDYSITFTNDLPDANYSIIGSAGFGSNRGFILNDSGAATDSPPTASSFRIRISADSGTDTDAVYVNVAIFSN